MKFMAHHNPAQQAAWEAIDRTLEAMTAAALALKLADEANDDEAYPRLLAASLRADREFEGAWAHYHRI